MNERKLERWDILIFETAEEYLKKKAIEEKRKAISKFISDIKFDRYKKDMEAKGVCEHCGNDVPCRWIRYDEFYTCYECFIHDLECEADVMVPMRSVDQMRDYVDEDIWDDLSEEEHGLI